MPVGGFQRLAGQAQTQRRSTHPQVKGAVGQTVPIGNCQMQGIASPQAHLPAFAQFGGSVELGSFRLNQGQLIRRKALHGKQNLS